ncbi:YlbF family regulator [Clostridium sp. D2Q-11]|uniref:YlbF family regulator n=1 Tax=Anaeromonas frigoriresistens TaxID=2683708 RepID=A0A942UVP6_9FIRM|nr:YlbF family regulator [Anaeromonas frigoriresistens]MBS4539928.1 YlbF family regulator [Anaeromonas frigoriresistens]
MYNNVLDIARKLGKSIQNSEVFNDYLIKEELFYNDKEAVSLQKDIEDKNILQKKAIIDRDTEKINVIKCEIDKLNNKLLENTQYNDYTAAKDKVEKLMKNIDNILEYFTGISGGSGCDNCSGKCGK